MVAFLLAILGMALIEPIANLIERQVNPTSITNESVDISSVWYIAGDQSNVLLNMTTNLTPSNDNWTGGEIVSWIDGNNSALTEDTDWTDETVTFTISLLNTSTVVALQPISNTTYISYAYYEDDYLQNSGVSRTLVALVILFFALGVLIAIWAIISKAQYIKAV